MTCSAMASAISRRPYPICVHHMPPGPSISPFAGGVVDVDSFGSCRDSPVRLAAQPHGVPRMHVVPVVVLADRGRGIAEF